MSSQERVPCVLIGGPFAGWKTSVPQGKRILDIDVPLEGKYRYELRQAVFMDADSNVSVVLGTPEGETAGDAFMAMLAAYCKACRPDDYPDEPT